MRSVVRELEAEYKQLQSKNRQSRWYRRKVSAASGLTDEEQSQPPAKKRKSRSTTPFPRSSPSEPSTPLSTDNVSQPLSPGSSVMYSSEDAHSSSNRLSLSPGVIIAPTRYFGCTLIVSLCRTHAPVHVHPLIHNNIIHNDIIHTHIPHLF